MNTSLKKILFISASAALICAGAFIKIPIGVVPVSLQTMFVLAIGLLLPLSISLPSVLTYLVLGIVGLPVFTGGGGISIITGPTGGYLIGLVPAVIILYFFSRNKNIFLWIIGSLLANSAIYICGLLMLKNVLNLDFKSTLSVGLFPFIIGDIIKTAVAITVSYKLKDKINKIFKPDTA